MAHDAIRSELTELFMAGVAAADPVRAVAQALKARPVEVPDGGTLILLAVGKAATGMMQAARAAVPEGVQVYTYSARGNRIQRLDYLVLCESELASASSRPTLVAKAYCALQIGYFKAKHAFFRFTWDDVQEDCAFVLTRYFNDRAFEPLAITKHEHYKQAV